jgi:hypothetical protein
MTDDLQIAAPRTKRSGDGARSVWSALVAVPIDENHRIRDKSLVMPAPDDPSRQLRQAVTLVALLNLGYFGVEFAVATAIGSVSLFADSVDFLEDASRNNLEPSVP